MLVGIFFTSALLNFTETNVEVLRMGTCSTSMSRTLGLCEDASMSTCVHTVACVFMYDYTCTHANCVALGRTEGSMLGC